MPAVVEMTVSSLTLMSLTARPFGGRFVFLGADT